MVPNLAFNIFSIEIFPLNRTKALALAGMAQFGVLSWLRTAGRARISHRRFGHDSRASPAEDRRRKHRPDSASGPFHNRPGLHGLYAIERRLQSVRQYFANNRSSA